MRLEGHEGQNVGAKTSPFGVFLSELLDEVVSDVLEEGPDDDGPDVAYRARTAARGGSS